MIEEFGDIWDMHGDAICITINGAIKKDGSNVMGAGIALQAKERMPRLDYIVGKMLTDRGLCTMVVGNYNKKDIIVLPTKYAYGIPEEDLSNVVPYYREKIKMGVVSPGWMFKSSIGLIRLSCKQLLELTNTNGYKRVLLPRPGCSNGQLSWDEVSDSLADILDDRFVVVDFQTRHRSKKKSRRNG